MKIKIALIDTGIDKRFVKNSICNVKHFSIVNHKIVNEYQTPLKNHGTLCFQEILKQNVSFDILDINIIGNEKSLISKNIVLGINKAIDLKSDIINISLGFTNYDEEVFCACQKAVDNNILIISAVSHTREVSYPSSFKNVVAVDVNNGQDKFIQKINDSTLSIRMEDKIIYQDGKMHDFSSTSMASAYFSGIFAKQLNENPLLDKFFILKKIYGLKYLDPNLDFISKLECNLMPLYEKIKNKKLAAILLPNNVDIIDFCNFKNIYAIYDHKTQKFHNDKAEEVFDFDLILILNSIQYPISVPQNLIKSFNNKELLFIGKFQNIENNNVLVYSHKNFTTDRLSTLNNPVVMVAGVSWELGKFDVQQTLWENFTKSDFDVKSVTYNPKGVLYGFDVFEYPEKVVFPDIVCSINNYAFFAENNNDFDLWLINVGGGMFINRFNKFSFGKLTEAYFQALDVDVLILVVPTYTSVEVLEINIKKAFTYGIKEVLFVVSENDFESSSIKSSNAITTYRVDKKKYLNNAKYLKNNCNRKIFTIEDVNNGKLYEEIVSILC